MTTVRRTQAERRAATRGAVLDAAIRLFGRKGYADASLEEIAAEAGTTIRPIYHYVGSKQGLFRAVNGVMEERILESLEQSAREGDRDGSVAWRGYLALCEDPGFRRIVLVDGPNVLGRERWATSPVTRTVAARLRGGDGERPRRSALAARMLIGALAEAALAIAESNDPGETSREAERLVVALGSTFGPQTRETPS